MTAPANPGTTDDQKSQELDFISSRLIAARASGAALHEFPGRLPETLSDAYAVQTASIARWPDEIAGWKVGMVPAGDRSRLGAERLAGPIFKSSIRNVDVDSGKTMPIYDGGFAAVEAEFVLQLATTIEPVKREYDDDALAELVATLHVGAEIASSPMADVNKLGPCCVVSDFGNNEGLLVGPSVRNWRALPLNALQATVVIDDVVVGSATADAIEGGLMQPLRFLINLCADRQLVLSKGTYVSCGAVTGIHDVTTSSKARVEFAALGGFDVAFEAMTPRQ